MLYVNRFRLDEDDEFQEVESVVNEGQVSMTKRCQFYCLFFFLFYVFFAHAKHTGPQAHHAWKKKKHEKRGFRSNNERKWSISQSQALLLVTGSLPFRVS